MGFWYIGEVDSYVIVDELSQEIPPFALLASIKYLLSNIYTLDPM